MLEGLGTPTVTVISTAFAPLAVFERAPALGPGQEPGKSKGPRFPEFVNRSDAAAMVPIIREPRDLITVVAGGAGGKSMFLPTAGAQSLAVSKAIEQSGASKEAPDEAQCGTRKR